MTAAPSARALSSLTFCRESFDGVGAAINGHDATVVCALLEAIFALQLEALGAEAMALLHEVVHGLLAGDFDWLGRAGHVAKVFEDFAVELGQDQVLMLVLQVARPHHLG